MCIRDRDRDLHILGLERQLAEKDAEIERLKLIKLQASPADPEEQEDNEALQDLPEYARPPYG